MASPYNLPDYVSKYFEYKQLDKIHGKPSIESILQLFRQVKRNAQCVRTTLGGGQFGYLALVVPQTVYNSIANATPFLRPQDPGPFIITTPPLPTATRSNPNPVQQLLTNADIATQKATHDTALRLFNECQAVELALRNQITDAVESEYLSALRNSITDMIPSDIPAILAFLQNTYGKISPTHLMEKEDELKDFIYDPTQPIDVIFNNIDRFSNLCELVGDPISDRRKVNISYKLISKNTAFRDSLKSWNRKPATAKVYADMKTFMREEYNDLDEVGGLSVDNSSLNQAHILQEMKIHQEQMAERMEQNLKINMIETLTGLCGQLENEENIAPQQESANNLAQPNFSDNAMFQLLTSLQNKVEALSSNRNRNTSSRFNASPPNTSGEQELPTTNPNTGKAYKRYCWTHGCTSHWGRHCKNKKTGHKDEATFKDRMGGSDKNCLPNAQR